MQSLVRSTGVVELPLVTVHTSMVPFNVKTLEGLTVGQKQIVSKMLENVPCTEGTAYFTLHGRPLVKGETQRRGGPHIDGNYEPCEMDFGRGGGNGWKVGENGRPVGHPTHTRQYIKSTGGIVMVSNYHACNGWVGEFTETPKVGGDCGHFKLGKSLELQPGVVYYGNNHFIHESLPMADDVHRVFARITMPESHQYVEVQSDG